MAGQLQLGRPRNLPRRRAERAEIDLADIQGNVLRGYTFPSAAYLFLHIDDVDRARALLTRALPNVATAESWRTAPATAVQVAFTHGGLRALGVSEEVLASFPEEFREGMAARAERLGDRGPSAPGALGGRPWHRRGARARHRLRRRRGTPRAAPRAAARDGPRRRRDDAGPRDPRRGAAGRTRPLRLLRRDRAARRRGQRRARATRRRAARRRGRLARRAHRRVPPRLRRRGRHAARRARRALRPQRHVRGVAQAAHGRRGASADTSTRRGGPTPAGPNCSPPRSSGAGATAPRCTARPTVPTRRSSTIPAASTTSPSRATRAGCAARPARTSAAPTRATPRASSTGA